MKKTIHVKYILILFVLIAAAGLLAQIVIPQTTPNPVSLRLRAAETGNYVSYDQPNIFPRYGLNQVVLQSTDIITGTAGTNRCRLSPDETTISTDFQVTVQTVLKGSLPVGSTITVSIPGGRAAFQQPNGTVSTAEIRAPWFKRLTNGSQYYFFLTGSAQQGTGQLMKPSAGPQGVFEVVNGVVISNSGRLRDPMWQYNNMSIANFQLAIQQAFNEPPYGPTPMLQP